MTSGEGHEADEQADQTTDDESGPPDAPSTSSQPPGADAGVEDVTRELVAAQIRSEEDLFDRPQTF